MKIDIPRTVPQTLFLEHTVGCGRFVVITLSIERNTNARPAYLLTRSWGPLGSDPVPARTRTKRFDCVQRAITFANRALSDYARSGFRPACDRTGMIEQPVFLGGATLGADVRLGAECVFGQHVRVGDGSVLARGVALNALSWIGQRCHVATTDIRGPLVAPDDMVIAPGARTRGAVADATTADVPVVYTLILHPDTAPVLVTLDREWGSVVRTHPAAELRSSLEASYATRGYDAIAQIEQLLVESLHEDRVHHGGGATRAMIAASDDTRRWLVPKLPAWGGPTPLETTIATHDAACHALPACAF